MTDDNSSVVIAAPVGIDTNTKEKYGMFSCGVDLEILTGSKVDCDLFKVNQECRLLKHVVIIGMTYRYTLKGVMIDSCHRSFTGSSRDSMTVLYGLIAKSITIEELNTKETIHDSSLNGEAGLESLKQYAEGVATGD
jgi:hypothetical protein